MTGAPALVSERFGLYLHIPVCVAKCPYCDFVSHSLAQLPDGGMARIVSALERELDLALVAHPELRGRPLDSIYFGGGTPSLLPADDVARLIRLAKTAFALRDATTPEITLECNPVTAEVGRLAAYRDAGVNRISLGVQNFSDPVLKGLGRLHSADEARAAIDCIRSLDFASWGFDLIFGGPGSTVEQWRDDLTEALRHSPPHLSVYGMTLHEGTALFERNARGEIDLPGEDAQRQMFLMARHTLTEAGWRHYEISNYARPGHESRHNSLYWTGGDYLGIGVAAHSYFGGRRRANPARVEEYLQNVEAGKYAAAEEEQPSPRARRGERIMLALRRCEGVALSELDAAIGDEFRTTYAAEIADLESRGLLVVTSECIRLSEEGLLLSDLVFEAFF